MLIFSICVWNFRVLDTEFSLFTSSIILFALSVFVIIKSCLHTRYLFNYDNISLISKALDESFQNPRIPFTTLQNRHYSHGAKFFWLKLLEKKSKEMNDATMRTFRRTPRRFSPFGFRTNYIFHVVPFTVLLFGIYFVLIIPSMPFEYYACASVGEVGSEEGQRHTCIGPMLGNRREVALGGQKAQREEKVQSSKSPDAEDCGLHSLRETKAFH